MTDQFLPPGWLTQSATLPYWPKSLVGPFRQPAYEPWNQFAPQSWQQPIGAGFGSIRPSSNYASGRVALPVPHPSNPAGGILGNFPQQSDAEEGGSATSSFDGPLGSGRGILALLDQRNAVGGILAPLDRLNSAQDGSLSNWSQPATPFAANVSLFARPIVPPWINSRPEFPAPAPISSLPKPSFGSGAPTVSARGEPYPRYALFGANASTPSSQDNNVASARHLESTSIHPAWEPLGLPGFALNSTSPPLVSNVAATADSAGVISDTEGNEWVPGARYAQAQARGGRRGAVGRELTVPEQNRIFFYNGALETLRQLDPKNPNLESLSTPGWIPRQEDINRLNEEIVRLKRERGLSWLEPHHTMPRQFRDKFDELGIDIEDYITHMPNYLHRLRPNGLHTGRDHWNGQWKRFFDEHPNPTPDDVFSFLNSMLKQIPRGQP